MKLSKRGLKGLLGGYLVMLFAVGLIIITKTVPENIWVPIFIIGGLVGLTVSGYMFGKPMFGDDPKIEINLKKLFRRGK